MNESATNIYKALAKAQAEFGPVVKNRKANYGMYADLGAILDVVRPALNRNGVFLSQKVTSQEDGVVVETILGHESGETLSSGPLFMPVGDVRGSKAQAFGSARTYACRYSLSAFLGIAADDDDDGQSAGMSAPQPQAKPSAPAISPDLLQGAEDAVKEGADAYKAFFGRLGNDARQALTKSGYHARFKNQLGI